mgnify:CR=1 FL=1
MPVSFFKHWLLPPVAGALFVAGLSPFDLWPTVMVSQALLAWHWLRCPNLAVRTGFLYGAGFFLAGASWVYVSIHIYGRAAPPLALLLTALFCLGLATLFALQGWCFRRFMAPRALPLLLGFPALWVLFEWLRSWLLTGFPWLYAGYAGIATPLAGWAPLTGVFGLSLLFAALAAGLVVVAISARRLRALALWLLGASLIMAAGALLEQQNWTEASNTPLSVALYQPNIPLERKWDRREFRSILRQYERATAPLIGSHDLILWPESAIPAYKHQVDAWLSPIAQRLKRADSALISGIAMRDAGSRYNSIFGMGNAGGDYHKQKLVPFGEYVPLESWLRGLIAFFDLPMSHFVSGPANQSMLTLDSLSIAPFICYEIVYPDFVARHSREADFLITISNDSWFGRSIGPLQHLQMARFRALETGRPLLRGTNNGVTAIVDHRGNIQQALPQFEEAVLHGEIQPRRGSTPFMLTGSLPVLGVAFVALFAAWRCHHSGAAGPDY